MKKLSFIFSLLVLVFTFSYQQKIDLGKNATFRIKKNVSYGQHPEQKLDMYIPESESGNNDVFIIIHGGGWRGGQRSQLTGFTFDLMKKFPQNIFVNIDYRLATTKRFALPNQMDDIKDAMSYVEKNLKYQPKYILLGNCAGGNLSMLYAYKFDKEKKVKAVVNIVGPADLSDSGFKNYDDYSFIEKHMIDPKIVDKNISLMDFGSPTYWVNASSAPTISFYGTQDHVVPVSQKRILDSVLVKNNVPHESYEFNGNHLSWEDQPNSSFLIKKIAGFLRNLN
ncbi:alpha/beta hydrolase [Chryseobacterium daeguense]|uniref:alpha/beta hydrolase n=1 Tax=Chryseobacterium daeguense TaxID=412438 RepID=UPI0003F53E38|nr:alpha/beta hydrolase [Chryseobacterium daeguense]